MKFTKKKLLSSVILCMLAFGFRGYLSVESSAKAASLSSSLPKEQITEKRGSPPYDHIMGKDHLPHFRVFFWVPLTANNYKPAAAKGVNTNVSHHGPVENWSVVETNIRDENEKLVYIFVPKTFVILHGKNFYKVIFLNYKQL